MGVRILACAGHDGEQLLQLTEYGVRVRPAIRFWIKAQQGAEGLGEDGEGDVAVPADEAAAFEVVDAETGLEFTVVVFDPPAERREADQGFQ